MRGFIRVGRPRRQGKSGGRLRRVCQFLERDHTGCVVGLEEESGFPLRGERTADGFCYRRLPLAALARRRIARELPCRDSWLSTAQGEWTPAAPAGGDALAWG